MKLALPPLLFIGILGIFTLLGMKLRLFVGWFGCGCNPGFNANDFANCVFLSAVGLLLLHSYRLTRPLGRCDRVAYYVTLGPFLVGAGFVFSSLNYWL